MTTARHAESQPLIRPSAWPVGIAALAGGAAVMVTALLAAHHTVFQGDAVAYRIVGRNPFADGSALQFGVHTTGVAIRYGRVGYPLAAWLLAFGRAGWVGWTMGLVSLASVAVAGAAAAELCARAGRPAWSGLAVFAAPVMVISMTILYAEPLVVALILLTYLMWLDGRHIGAAVAGAYLVLVRDATGLALLPLLIDAARRRDRRDVVVVLAAFAPYAGWATWVRFRVGNWPFLDPSTSGREAVGAPFLGYVKGPYLVLFAIAAVTVLVAVWLQRQRPWFPVTQGALVLALVNLCLKPGVLRYPGDALRVMGPSQALIILAAVLTFSRAGRQVMQTH